MERELKHKIIHAHKACCPYNTDQFKQEAIFLGKPIKCGAGEEECTNSCHYMQTFIKALKRITR